MSYAPEVTTGMDPKFYGNRLRFETYEEANNNVMNLMRRWTMVTSTRVVESEDPVNYKWEGGAATGRLVNIEGE